MHLYQRRFTDAIMPATPQSPSTLDMNNLSPEDRSRIIEMAWDDRTPFEAIFQQFGLRENDVRKLMRRSMKTSSFRRWRERVSGRATKHEKRSPANQRPKR
jgi:uncharacterized protein (TIGR03643 family)